MGDSNGFNSWSREVKLVEDKAFVILLKEDFDSFNRKIKEQDIEMVEDQPNAGNYGISGYRYNLYLGVQTAKPLKNTLRVCLKANYRDFLTWEEVVYAAPFMSITGFPEKWFKASKYGYEEYPVHNTMIACPKGSYDEIEGDENHDGDPEKAKEFYKHLQDFAKEHNMYPVYKRHSEPDGKTYRFEITKDTKGDVFTLSKEFEQTGLGWLYPVIPIGGFYPPISSSTYTDPGIFSDPFDAIPPTIEDFTFKEDEESDDLWINLKGQWFLFEETEDLWNNDRKNWFDEKWW